MFLALVQVDKSQTLIRAIHQMVLIRKSLSQVFQQVDALECLSSCSEHDNWQPCNATTGIAAPQGLLPSIQAQGAGF
eukprot:12646158-Ditylum_brightwellii.AAC.1